LLLFDQKNFELKELLDLIPGNVCMINEEGEIIYVNSSWKNFYQSGVVANFPGLIVGSDYLEECARWKIISEEQVNGIRSVINGDCQFFETVYLCDYLDQEKWFLLKAVALLDKKGCMVLKFDVTEKENAEEKSKINEAILKSLIDNSPALIYMKDMNGKYTHVNKIFEQVTGAKKAEIVGKKPYEVFPWSVADRFVKNDRKVIGTRRPLVVEEQFTINEDVKTFYSILFPLHGDGGNLIGLAGISSDITDRKIAEEKLQQYKKELEESLSANEERLEHFFAATTDGLWDWDLITDEMFFRPCWLESLGYKPGELESNSDSWKSLVHPDDLPKLLKSLSDHFEGKTNGYQCENRILRKDGTWRWNLDQGRVVKRDETGRPLRVVGSDRDITRLKEAEFALRASEQNLAQAQEMACLGSWELDVQKNSLLWSDEVYQIFGVNRKKFKPSYEAFLGMVHPDDRDWVHEEYVKSIYEKKTYDINHRIILPDDSKRIVHVKSKTFYDSKGDPERVIGTVCDITEKKNAEENLKKSRQQLRNLSNKLQSIREEDKKRISREIHDELGQTLTAIKLDLTWLEKRIDVSESPVQDKIKSIYSHIESSLETVRRVSTELRPQVLDVMGFCEALQWQAEKFMENTNIKCKLNIEPEGIKLQPELSKDLFRIFQEALTNISRHSQASQVIINFVENKTGYQLCVKDDGVGIDQLQIDHSTSLGLLGIRERALIWEGHVEIKGVVGEGTQLTVEIPKLNND
jgi:PAS domain S-box-containing protein